MEPLLTEVTATLYQLDHALIIKVCEYTKCALPEGGFSSKTKRGLIKMIECELEAMVEKEDDQGRVRMYLKGLLLFMDEMREVSRGQGNTSPDQSHLFNSMHHSASPAHKHPLREQLPPMSHHPGEEARHSTPLHPHLPEVVLRREFKIMGQIGEGGQKDRLSYTSLVHQIDSGLRKGHSEQEVIEAVTRAVSPGLHLRHMLEIKSNLTVPTLKTILKGHYKEESTSDIYHRLVNISQEPKESAQTFLFRAIELKERLLWKSNDGDTDDYYDPQLIQRKFLRAIETGLLSDSIKFQMRPFLSDIMVSDEMLIDKLNEAASLEGERQKKLKRSANGREARVCEIQADMPSTSPPAEKNSTIMVKEPQKPSSKQPQAQDSVTHLMLEQLKADVYEMRQVFLAAMEASTQFPQRQPNYQPAARGRPEARRRPRGCAACQQAQREDHCDHCFRCGDSGHVSRGCRMPRQTGNGNGLLRGDHQ